MTDLRAVDLVDLFRRELELCKVTAGEHLVILAEPTSRSDYVAAAFGAARLLKAHVIQATVPSGSPTDLPSSRTGSGAGLKSVEEDTLARDLLKGADIVVDLTMEGFIHTPLIGDMLAAGTRVIFAADPPEVLERNLPRAEDKDRVLAAADLLRTGKELRVTSPAGTELVADLEDANPGFQCGFADEPGRWDHWPSTMVLCWPRTSHGTIVLQPGDVLLPFKSYLQSQVTLQIENGYIESVTGGAEADFLQRFFDDSDDPEARFLSHMGWGLMPSADWFALSMYDRENLMGMDARAHAGNFLFSTGPHPFMGRTTPYHLDIPMRGCNVFIDEYQVVKHGHLVD